jgi:hypothetical protein
MRFFCEDLARTGEREEKKVRWPGILSGQSCKKQPKKEGAR